MVDEITLVRHGESIGNTWTPAYRDDRMNFLSTKGVRQTEIAAIDLATDGHTAYDHIVTTEALRCRQTTSIITQHLDIWKQDVMIDPRLNEWGHAERNPETYKEWLEQRPSEENFNLQVIDTARDIMKLDGNVLLVSHYYTMTVLIEVIAAFARDESLTAMVDLSNTDHSTIPNAVPYVMDTKDNPYWTMLGSERYTKDR